MLPHTHLGGPTQPHFLAAPCAPRATPRAPLSPNACTAPAVFGAPLPAKHKPRWSSWCTWKSRGRTRASGARGKRAWTPSKRRSRGPLRTTGSGRRRRCARKRVGAQTGLSPAAVMARRVVPALAWAARTCAGPFGPERGFARPPLTQHTRPQPKKPPGGRFRSSTTASWQRRNGSKRQRTPSSGSTGTDARSPRDVAAMQGAGRLCGECARPVGWRTTYALPHAPLEDNTRPPPCLPFPVSRHRLAPCVRFEPTPKNPCGARPSSRRCGG